MSGAERGLRSPVRAATALVVALFLLALPAAGQSPPAGGGSPPRVVLFAKDPTDPLVRRVAAELHSLGFDVVTGSDDDTVKSSPQMEAIAQSSDAVAAVRVALGDSSIDLWIVNVRTHETVLRHVVSGKDPAVAAFRSVEALRVSLIDLQALVPPPPPEPELAPRAPETRESAVVPPPPRRATLGFELGLGAASGSGGFDPTLHAVGQVQWMAGVHLGIHLLGVAPLMSSRVTAGEGLARVTFGILGSGVTWQPLVWSAWTPYLGAGLAGVLLYTRGVPSTGFVGYSQVNLTAAPYLRLGSSFSLAGAWRLSADLLAAATTPEPVVFFADRKASAWGRPLLLGTLGIEIAVR